MADDDPVFIDLSQFFSEPIDYVVEPLDLSTIPGLKPTGPITITCYWNPEGPRYFCALCRQSFAPGPEGVPVLTHTGFGSIGPVCPDCVMPYLD